MRKKLNKKLKSYIETNILPVYDDFDKGHGKNHILAVAQRSLSICSGFDDIDENIVYTAACYHDIGMKIERKNHALHSKELVLKDENLKNFFTQQEIETIAQACADHSTSAGIKPKSIYGMILSDADKDDDIDISLSRAWEYSINHFPENTFDDNVENIYQQIVMRFGENGTVKYYIISPQDSAFLKTMKLFIKDKNYLRNKLKEISHLPDC